MSYPSEKHGPAMVVSLNGEVDLKVSPQARKQILAHLEANFPVLVDLSAVQYIDSSGVASLVEGLQMAKAKQLGFALTSVSEPAMQVLHLARLDQVFTIHSNIEEGVAALSKESK